MSKAKYKIGEKVYYKTIDMFGSILGIDEDDMDDMIFYYIEFPCCNTWVNEWYLEKEADNG